MLNKQQKKPAASAAKKPANQPSQKASDKSKTESRKGGKGKSGCGTC